MVMKVAVLNYPGVVPTSVTGPCDILEQVGPICQMLRAPNRIDFLVDIVNTGRNPSNVLGGKILPAKKQYDLIIVPAMNFEAIQPALEKEKALVKWIQTQYEGGSEVAGICLGCFLLAKTGLLNGKRATTHWMGAPYFKQLFPEVKLESDKLIIDEGRIYTCGAAYAFTSLMVYLVEKLCGRPAALAVAKVFMIQLHDTGQDAFSIFNLQHNHQDEQIKVVQRFMERTYAKKMSIDSLASRYNMSPRTFIRKFTAVTGNTPLEYIQRVRVEAAKHMLERGKWTIDEVSRRVGYNDLSSFRLIFKRFTDLSPSIYRRRYAHPFHDRVVRSK